MTCGKLSFAVLILFSLVYFCFLFLVQMFRFVALFVILAVAVAFNAPGT